MLQGSDTHEACRECVFLSGAYTDGALMLIPGSA